jgi:hypothetical protein
VFSQDHSPAQSPVSSIVGRFKSSLIDESPYGLPDFEDILESLSRFFVTQQRTDIRQIEDFLADRSYHNLEIEAGECAFSKTMPTAKERFEVRPTDLAKGRIYQYVYYIIIQELSTGVSWFYAD